MIPAEIKDFMLFAVAWYKIILPVIGIVGACAAAAFLFPTLRLQAVGVAALAIGFSVIYGWGWSARGTYESKRVKAHIERAIKRGAEAEAKALKKFEESPETYTDEFERKE